MVHAVLVSDRGGGCGVLGEEGVDLAAVVVEHEDLAEVGTGCLQELQAVGLRLGQSLLVAKDHFGGVVLDPPQGDEAAAFHSRTGARTVKVWE